MYKDMTKLLEEKTINEFKLEKFTISKDNFSAMIAGIPIGEYIKLTKNGNCIMSNTPMEQRTNLEFCKNAYGDVLIGGLGLGMILVAIQDKEEIKSITVIEKYQDVIDLISNQLPLNDKVKIIKGDVFSYKPEKQFDCIYMDIWSYINSDVYEEMEQLKNKYSKYLKSIEESPYHFNKCWAEYYAKYNKRLY